MGLPGRAEIVDRLAELLAGGGTRPAALPQDTPTRRPAVYVVAIDGYGELVAADTGGAATAVDEVARRLDRLVRHGDVLGRLAEDRFVLVASGTSPAFAGAIVERIEGAAALPVEIAGDPVSLSVSVGVAFSAAGADAAGVVAEAEAEADRLGRR